MDSENVMSWLEGLAEPDWRECYSDSEVQNIAKSALELLKAQRETIDELISADKTMKLIEKQKAVVRCKDCKHYLAKGILSFCNLHGIFRVGCDGCSDEVKRE